MTYYHHRYILLLIFLGFGQIPGVQSAIERARSAFIAAPNEGLRNLPVQTAGVSFLRISEPIKVHYRGTHTYRSGRTSVNDGALSNSIWAQELSQLMASSINDGNNDIAGIVKNWTKTNFEAKRPEEILDYIFNDLESIPLEVATAIDEDVFTEVLQCCLNRCNSAALCNLFDERCSSIVKAIGESNDIAKLFPFSLRLNELGLLAKSKKIEMSNEMENASRDQSKSTKLEWADELSQLVADSIMEGKDDIVGIVKNWTKTNFEAKSPEEILDYIFNDIEPTPLKVATVIDEVVFTVVLQCCLDQCNSAALCSLFNERCSSIVKAIGESKDIAKLFPFSNRLTEWGLLAKIKEQRIEKTTAEEGGLNRIASIAYGIDNSTKMHNLFDLIRFTKRIDELFEWFGGKKWKNFKTYLAPYFPLIQSSGTGKTLLLDKFNRLANERKDTYSQLFLCIPNVYNSKIHKEFLVEKMKVADKPNVNAAWIYLDSLIPDNPKIKKIVFLFDEAQRLLDDEAIYFRYIRWWLRQKRDVRIVAVFTGTTSRLSNYYPETLVQSQDSRNPRVHYWNSDGEYESYLPFFDLTTMGSLSSAVNENKMQKNEYERAAFFGRPLFAKLQNETNKEMGLNDERRYAILERMLFGNIDYKLCESVLMNILGTRVHMGHVSVTLASILVSSGYAHLVSIRLKSSKDAAKKKKKLIDEDIAHICYQPDPVCAHLAMCLMDKSWNCKRIKGQSPKFWTAAATQLFSSGICHPSKGDVGEVATALYLLFCGDILRQRLNSNYMEFSVDLTSYVDQLLQCSSSDTKVTAPPNLLKSTSKYTINFIQVARQYFRMPQKYLYSQETLEWMYSAACAIYLPTNAEVFDILAPIKCVDEGGNTVYVPFTVTVKSRRRFGAAEVENEIKRMKTEASDIGLENGLCLLVLLDVKNSPLKSETELNQTDLVNLTSNVVCKAIAIQDDCFGINKLVQNTRIVTDNKLCEVYSSHSILPALPDIFWEIESQNYSRYTKSVWEYGKSVASYDNGQK